MKGREPDTKGRYRTRKGRETGHERVLSDKGCDQRKEMEGNGSLLAGALSDTGLLSMQRKGAP